MVGRVWWNVGFSRRPRQSQLPTDSLKGAYNSLFSNGLPQWKGRKMRRTLPLVAVVAIAWGGCASVEVVPPAGEHPANPEAAAAPPPQRSATLRVDPSRLPQPAPEMSSADGMQREHGAGMEARHGAHESMEGGRP
jgi:hypothetical protein